MRSDVKKLIGEAIKWSPSGDNCQPFKFRWENEKLFILHDEQIAKHKLNISCFASLISLGCILENITIVAHDNGLELIENINQNSPLKNVVLEFKENSSISKNLLSEFIPKRVTDRRVYQGGWDNDFVGHLISCSREERYVAELKLIEKVPSRILNYFGKFDQIVWKDVPLFYDFIKWVRFSKEKALSTRDGLPAKNLGLDFISTVSLWFCSKSYILQRFFCYAGAAAMTRLLLWINLRSSAGFAFIYVPEFTPINFVHTGRLAQRIWLELTKAGYSVQPLTLITLIRSLHVKGHQVDFKQGILDFFKSEDQFMVPDIGTPSWGFRWGVCQTPLSDDAKTYRRDDLEIKS